MSSIALIELVERAPILIIHGTQDVAASSTPCTTTLKAMIPNSVLKTLDTNHCPMLELPDEFAALIDEFVSSLSI